jgi:PIN domain nuclease of toxin-antitoxin system
VVVSTAVVWEGAIKRRLGKLDDAAELSLVTSDSDLRRYGIKVVW